MSAAAPLVSARGQENSSARTTRSDNRFAVIEHACGKRIGFPFCRMACRAQKFAAFFRANRI
jgi:hypothetical protein